MTNQLITPPRGLDRNGEPQSGALAYIYQSGTLTAVTVTDASGTPLTWPVVADIDGAFPQMFYAGSYILKAVITDADGVILPAGTIDPVAVVTNVSAASGIAFTPTSAVPYTNVQAAIAAVGTAEVANTAAVALINAATVIGAGLAVGSGVLPATATITVAAATNAEAIAGALTTKAMTPASTAAAIAAGKTTMTAVATTSGTAIDVTGIPSGVKRVTIMLAGVSTSGTNSPLLRIGAGSVVTTGYLSSASAAVGSGGGSLATSSTAGFLLAAAGYWAAAEAIYGAIELVRVTGNQWVSRHILSDSGTSDVYTGAGGITLSGALDRIQLTTSTGTDTFDAGSISVMYE